MEPEVVVTWDADALEDLELLTGRGERKAVIVAIRKLRNVGNALGPPHVKSLKSEPGLMELRPRQRSSPVRLIFRRGDRGFVILAVAVKPDTADFARALVAARARYSRHGD